MIDNRHKDNLVKYASDDAIDVYYSQETLPDFIINEDIRVDMRYARARTCDVKYFTVWCKSSQMHLTSIEIPNNIFVSM